MQFKRQGHKIQVLAYDGYDKDKKRAIVKMLGSLDVYTLAPSVGLLDKLTAEQREELQSYVESIRQSDEQKVLQSVAYLLDSNIAKVADGLLDTSISYSSDSAAKIWAAIGALSKALRKSGHPKPKRERKAKAQADDTGTGDLFADEHPPLPAGDHTPLGVAEGGGRVSKGVHPLAYAIIEDYG